VEFSWPQPIIERRQALMSKVHADVNPLLTADKASLTRNAAQAFSRSAWQLCAEAGVLGLSAPQALGGSGLDMRSTVYLLEGLGEACASTSLAYCLCAQMVSAQYLLQRFGSREQQDQFLKPMVQGHSIGAFAISELEAGSDAMNVSTQALRVEGGYQLNGEKRYVTLAPVADIALVFATTQPERGAWGVSVFIVDLSQLSVVCTPTQKVGLQGAPMGTLEFSDCFVPEHHRVGKEGAGLGIFGKVMEAERAYILSSQIGGLTRQLDAAIAHVKSRKQGGKPIGKHQAVADRIVDMKLRLETSKLMLYHVAWLDDQDQNLQLMSALANLHMSEALLASSIDAFRNSGVRAYVGDDEVIANLLDGLGSIVYSGTSDIQRVLAAKGLGL